MARYIYQGTFHDQNGRLVGAGTTANSTDGVIYVYLAGTTTAASVYTASSGGTAVNSVETDDNGHFSFWVDDSDYAFDQLFKITLTHADFESKTYDNIKILPHLYTGIVSATDSTLSLTRSSHANKIVMANRAAGIAFTLPEATGTGDVYKIVVGTALTSNSITVTTADTTNADYVGCVIIQDLDAATTAYMAHTVQGTGDDIFTMNRTTTGGVNVGNDWVSFTDIATDLWLVDGRLLVPTGSNPATPFSGT